MVKLVRKAHKVFEMSVTARSVEKPGYYTKQICPDTIIKTLTCVKDIWSCLALHMVNDIDYVEEFVDLGYAQIEYLMNKYHNNNNAYFDHMNHVNRPVVDLADATKRLKRDRNPHYDVQEITPNESIFVFIIDCVNLDSVQRDLIVNCFGNAPQIDTTESGLHYVTSFSVEQVGAIPNGRICITHHLTVL